MKKPPFPTRDDLIAGYIAMNRAPVGSAEYHEAFWSFMIMDDLVEDFPEEAFEVIKRILDTDDADEVVGPLAAGPIEELLCSHGLQMIDAIESEARRNPKFNHALGGVWESDSLPEVWARVQAVRKSIW